MAKSLPSPWSTGEGQARGGFGKAERKAGRWGGCPDGLTDCGAGKLRGGRSGAAGPAGRSGRSPGWAGCCREGRERRSRREAGKGQLAAPRAPEAPAMLAPSTCSAGANVPEAQSPDSAWSLAGRGARGGPGPCLQRSRQTRVGGPAPGQLPGSRGHGSGRGGRP